jgi:hypothetical protein
VMFPESAFNYQAHFSRGGRRIGFVLSQAVMIATCR